MRRSCRETPFQIVRECLRPDESPERASAKAVPYCTPRLGNFNLPSEAGPGCYRFPEAVKILMPYSKNVIRSGKVRIELDRLLGFVDRLIVFAEDRVNNAHQARTAAVTDKRQACCDGATIC